MPIVYSPPLRTLDLTKYGGGTASKSLTLSGNEMMDFAGVSRQTNTAGDGFILGTHAGTGVWPAATNGVVNGGFETNTTNWIKVWGTETLTRIVGGAKFGNAYGECVTPNANAVEGLLTTVTYTAAAWTISAWLKGSGTIILRFKDASAVVQDSTPFTLTSTWTRYTFTATIANAGSGQFWIATSTKQAATIDVDGAQAELGSIATPYMETDGGTASRSAARVQMPNIANYLSATQGWVCARFMYGFANAAKPAQNVGLFEAGVDGNNRIEVEFSVSSSRWQCVRGGSASFANASFVATPAPAIGGRATPVAAWTSALNKISVNGAAFTTAAVGGIPSLPTNADLGTLPVEFAAAGGWANGNIIWFAAGSGSLLNSDPQVLLNFGDAAPSMAQLRNGLNPLAAPTALWDGVTGTFQVPQ